MRAEMLTRRSFLTTASAPLLAAPAFAARSSRLRTAICAYSFREALSSGKLRYDQLVDMAVENDVDGLDLTVYWLPQDDLFGYLAELRRKAHVNGVEIPSIAIRSDLCKKSAADQQREAAWRQAMATLARAVVDERRPVPLEGLDPEDYHLSDLRALFSETERSVSARLRFFGVSVERGRSSRRR